MQLGNVARKQSAIQVSAYIFNQVLLRGLPSFHSSGEQNPLTGRTYGKQCGRRQIPPENSGKTNYSPCSSICGASESRQKLHHEEVCWDIYSSDLSGVPAVNIWRKGNRRATHHAEPTQGLQSLAVFDVSLLGIIERKGSVQVRVTIAGLSSDSSYRLEYTILHMSHLTARN